VSADDNAKTIQSSSDAFGRGDIGYILDNVTDDVDWASDTASTAAPWYGPRHGKAEVTKFFDDLGSTMTVNHFEPVTIAANDDEVLAVVKYTTTRNANGRSAAMNLHHHFRFRDGKVAYWRGSEDSSQIETLFRD
jgi:ketosteroid isomerase-like protein